MTWLRRSATLWLVGTILVSTAWLHPVRAQSDFLTDLLMSESREKQLAEQEHPKILQQFGGVYRDPDLETYVSSIANFLGRVSRRPDITYRITILNSPVVNAFALPAGYLYVTRGLLALADTEAELAGVVAHEIGHVTARHTAQRYRNTVLAQGLVGLLGAAAEESGFGGLSNMLQPGAALFLQGFSRDHEHEADLLGVEAMSRAGYDPRAMASFLAKLGAHTRLEARRLGQGGNADQFNLFATHPRTVDRVERTIQAAGALNVRDPMTAREIYLGKLDRMTYGDDPEQGFVRGTSFIHPTLDFRFEVPEGFVLLNGQDQVVARHPRDGQIVFDRKPYRGGSVTRYLDEVWGKDTALTDIRDLEVNGLEAAVGSLRVDQGGTPLDLRLVAIRIQPEVLDRFLFAAPAPIGDALAGQFAETILSYRRLTRQEVREAKPFEIRMHRVRQGDSVASLAASLPYADFREERLRVMNGLGTNEEPQVGSLIKLVRVRGR